MANNTSFKLYSDSGLTTLYGGSTAFIHESDFSDNPQDLVLYFGSATTGRQLEAVSNPGVDNVTLTPTYILDDWAASTAYSVGDTVIPTTPNGYRYVVTTAGTSNSSEPSWTTTIGNTNSDSGVVWECIAETHATTEIKLAITSGGLDSATGGAALSLGTTLSSGSGNAVPVYIRITNTVPTVSSNVGNAELALNINSVVETAV